MAEERNLQSLLNDPFLKMVINEKENTKHMGVAEIQKWVDRCVSEVKLSTPRFDGNDVEGWTDECEAWLVNATKAENVKFCVLDIPAFRNMLQDWLLSEYDKVV